MDNQQRKEEVSRLLRDAITPAKGTTTITVHKLIVLVTPSPSGLEFLTAVRQILKDTQP